ncbi:Cdc2-related protein kinase, partial [Klebsormidium nitens]
MGSCCSKRRERGDGYQERELKVRPPRRARKAGADTQHVLSGSARSESSGRASARSQKPGSGSGLNGRPGGAASFSSHHEYGAAGGKPRLGRGARGRWPGSEAGRDVR